MKDPTPRLKHIILNNSILRIMFRSKYRRDKGEGKEGESTFPD